MNTLYLKVIVEPRYNRLSEEVGVKADARNYGAQSEI